MNKNGGNIVLSVQTPACDKLKRELEELLIYLQEGTIPDEDEISALKQSFQKYQDEVAEIKAQKARLEREAEEKRRLLAEKQKQVTFKDILPDEADDPFDIKYFEVIENVRLAKYLVLQKLVPEMVEEEYAQFVGYLIKKNYITKVSVAVKGESRNYHMLTSKGWHMVQQKDTLAAARATDPSFIIPEKLLGNPVTWEAETFLQAAILRKYYESLGISEFAIFIGDGDDQMLFGCEIRDSYSVSYSFAAYFVKEREKREAAILYEIAKSDKIDNLTLVLLDGKEEKRLKLQRGLDTRTLKKLRYYVLSEGEYYGDKK